MAKRMQFKRVVVLVIVLVAAFAGLGYRLVDLQIMRHSELSAKAQKNTQRQFLLTPRRGDILDAKGNLLAASMLVKNICADPTLLTNYAAEVAHALAPLLQLNEIDLARELTPS